MFDAAVPPALPEDAPLQQSRLHAAALARCGVPHLRLALPDGVQATLLLRCFGPLRLALWSRAVPDPAACHAIARQLPRATALIVNAETVPPAGLRHLPLLTAPWIAEWNIAAPPDRLRAGLAGSWRTALRRAEDQPLRVTESALPADPGHWLLRRTDAQARARGYRYWPATLTAAHAAADPAAARLFIARSNGHDTLAAMLFLIHGARATYHLGWSSDAGRASGAHRLILWRAALALSARGVRRLDLGTIDTETAAGLARFKLGTGARARALGPMLLRL